MGLWGAIIQSVDLSAKCFEIKVKSTQTGYLNSYHKSDPYSDEKKTYVGFLLNYGEKVK